MVYNSNATDDENLLQNQNDSPSGSELEKDKYKNSLMQKIGRKSAQTLFYVNQVNLENNGNGMSLQNKKEFVTVYRSTESVFNKKKDLLQRLSRAAIQLKSEVMNLEAEEEIKSLETDLYRVSIMIEQAKRFTVNEKRRLQLLKDKKFFLDNWYQRKQICMEFLKNMEEFTDGTISVRKCLKGGGQISVESDECFIADAINIQKQVKSKRKRGVLDRNEKRRKVQDCCQNINAGRDVFPSFVALRLIRKGVVKLIY